MEIFRIMETVPYTLKVEGREIVIPDDLIDMEEFIVRTIVMYPNIKCTGNIKNPFVFGKGELRAVVRTLSTYEQIARLVKRKGVKSDIGNAVGQMMIDEGASLEFTVVQSSMKIQNDPTAKETCDRLWMELGLNELE